jgi:hypothetical protein
MRDPNIRSIFANPQLPEQAPPSTDTPIPEPAPVAAPAQGHLQQIQAFTHNPSIVAIFGEAPCNVAGGRDSQ